MVPSLNNETQKWIDLFGLARSGLTNNTRGGLFVSLTADDAIRKPVTHPVLLRSTAGIDTAPVLMPYIGVAPTDGRSGYVTDFVPTPPDSSFQGWMRVPAICIP
jgi:hypothetical protein